MSLLDLLKTTPAKLTLGTVGVVGASAVAIKTVGKGTGKEKEDGPSDSKVQEELDEPTEETTSHKYSLAEKKLKSRFSEGMNDGKEWDTDLFSGTSNNNLNLKTFNCAPAFFPGVKWPETLNDPTNYSSETKSSPNPDLKSAPSTSDASSTQACFTSHLKRKKDHKMLLRSELTVKNENVGIAFWTVIKNYRQDKVIDRGPYYYLFLLEKGGETWSIKMGYFWGGEVSDSTDEIVTIKGPGKSPALSQNLELSDPKDIDQSFSGIWSEGEGSDKPLSLADEELTLLVEKEFSIALLPKIIGTPTFGSCKDDCFTDEGLFQWTTMKGSITQTQKNVVEATIESWYSPFKDKAGKWKTLNEHCSTKSESDLNADTNANDPCFMPNKPATA